MELKGKVEIYYATGKLYRKIHEQELGVWEQECSGGPMQGRGKKRGKVGIEQSREEMGFEGIASG